MGNTTRLNLPYPEGTDLVVSGDDQMQTLAEAIDLVAYPLGQALQIESGESGGIIGGGSTGVDFPGTITLSNGFEFPGGVLTYTGPKRMFMFSVSVETQATANGGVSSSVTLTINGTAVATTFDRVDIASTTITRWVTHNICVPGQLVPGTSIGVTCTGTPGTQGKTGIRIYPIGPQYL